ncbi:hypothetical protein F4775DRAFT_344021 [Biscogniauxia sp. FL1348]|nr:hypothetical protein F4775DRAFT_344021 [Biscogniauxia sp. FL1348]
MNDGDILQQLGLDSGLNTVTTDNGTEVAQFGSLRSLGSLESEPAISSNDTSKPYYSKRPHKKSRAGCRQCKRRKVKCDEAKPSCKACTLRKETCVYPDAAKPAPAPSPAPTQAPTQAQSQPQARTQSAQSAPPYSNSSAAAASPDSSVESAVFDPGAMVITEPLFRPGEMADSVDMKLLWFYTTKTFYSFSINTGRSPVIDHVLKVKVVEYAFQSPFLMDCLMALSALHLQSLDQPVPPQRLAAYRARAFEGYRTAIEAANPTDFPALLVCSLLMCALSSQMFREQNDKHIYIIDWMQVWRGISLIVDIISPTSIQESGMAVLFYRPPIDLERSTQYIPNNLLFMITSIKYGDADYEHQKTYYDFLRYFGSLYMELVEHGFSPIMDLRIITFLTFVPKPFYPLAREHRPRALVLLAYYLCFVKLLKDGVWWWQGISDREIKVICEEVGPGWSHLLRVPQMVMEAQTKLEVAKLIINNHNWTPKEIDLYERNRDPRSKADLKLITNDGTELDVSRGHWTYKATGIACDDRENASEHEYIADDPILLGTTRRPLSPALILGSSTTSSSSLGLSPSKSSSP